MYAYGIATPQPALSRVVFYGHLRRKFGREIELHVRSPRAAVKALIYVLPGFLQHMQQHATSGFKVFIGTRQLEFNGDPVHDMQELEQPSGLREIRIVPTITGAKKGGLGQIVLGAALIAFGVMTSGAGMGLMAAYAEGGLVMAAGSVAFSLGVGMVLGGISQILAKSPETQSVEKPDNKPSYAFDGAVNTVAQGNPVPVFYGGPMKVGSQVISAGISTAQIPIDAQQEGTTQVPPPASAPTPNVNDTMTDDAGNPFYWNGSAWTPGYPEGGGD